mmetsp:Transcript_10749/g.19431  ORF Transcript_10749/g.19431 Transcript_10749/m.19431 type:complete len:121 (+) Transcript_10749:83-445(+)
MGSCRNKVNLMMTLMNKNKRVLSRYQVQMLLQIFNKMQRELDSNEIGIESVFHFSIFFCADLILETIDGWISDNTATSRSFESSAVKQATTRKSANSSKSAPSVSQKLFRKFANSTRSNF